MSTAVLQVSENRRFLVDGAGRPFCWLADTAWELFHRLTLHEATHYLGDRARRGFNVIQAVGLAELDGLDTPNAVGERPLCDRDPTRPNPRYWEHVDAIVARANALGLWVAFLPTWGSWWRERSIFDPESAAAYGEWLGARYADSEVVWVLGGDRPVETVEQRAVVTAMADGLAAGDGGRHLRTFHPRGGTGSAEVFHDAPWLDFNLRQNGHGVEFGRYAATRADYDRTPVKPIIDGEPVYEDHPIDFNAAERGHSLAADVRRALYWDLFQGACGHTYGHHSVWQMWEPGREPKNAPLLSWRDALGQSGADQMRHARALLESRPYLSRVPADDLLVPSDYPTAEPGAGRYRAVATRDAEGRYACVYTPAGRPFTLRLDGLRGPLLAWWFDPRDGSARPAGECAAAGEPRWTPPTPGEALDWVLVLDEAAQGWGAPGTGAGGPRSS